MASSIDEAGRAAGGRLFAVRNPVLLTLVIAASVMVAATGFVSHAPNRLLSGQPLPLWQAGGLPAIAAIAALGLVLLWAVIVRPCRWLHATVIVAAGVLLLLTLDAAGRSAAALASPLHPAARTSLGPAFWALVIAAALAIIDAMQRLRARAGARLAVVAVIGGATALLAFAGRFDALSIMREYASHRSVFTGELVRHLALVLGAVVPALLLGVPLGIVAARRAGTTGMIFAALNLLQTIPSLAMFGLLMAPLAFLAARFPALGALGVRGIGLAPALIALFLYALLPVARNTHAGLVGVDPAVIESAKGMGFTAPQIFWRIELPLALPVLLAGLRIVIVQAIGLAVVAALIGAGGLGTFVFQGLGQYALDLILLGALPAILLALGADFALGIAVELSSTRRMP